MKKLILCLFSTLALSAYAKVNINTASIDELAMLKGLGKAKAEAIVAYREANGTFKSLPDIKKVKGIGETIFNRLKDDLTIEGETSFKDINPDNLKK